MKLSGVILILSCLNLSFCTKSKDTSNLTQETKLLKDQACEVQPQCASLRASESQCRQGKDAITCGAFIQEFKELAKITECKRAFDSAPVPNVWLCDETPIESAHPKLFERAIETLSLLKIPEAQEFFQSFEFRSILDGELAEKYGATQKNK